MEKTKLSNKLGTMLLLVMALLAPQLVWAEDAAPRIAPEPAPQAADGYYEISTAEHLHWFAEFVNTRNEDGSYPNTTANARLMNDIDAMCSAENQWIPIGKTREYNGIFDGAGKTITNLYIDSNDENNGFIARLTSGGVLKDLTIKNSIIKSTSDCTAAFVGYAEGAISGCKNYVAITGYNYSGGIVGKLVGSNTTPSFIINCENHASITSLAESSESNNYVGGIVGYMQYGGMTLCANTGDISSKGNHVGGLIGDFYLGKEISYSYNTGNVSSTSTYYHSPVGGIVGSLEQNSSTIINGVYNTGKVTSTTLSKIGAFVGDMNGYFNFSNCITLKENKQAFIGSIYSGTPILTNCESKTAEEFASGEVAWILNNSSDDAPVWHQVIGRDVLPTLEGNQYTVVHHDANSYYNEKEIVADPIALADGATYKAELAHIAADLTYTHSFDNSGAWYSYYVPFQMPVQELANNAVKVAYLNSIHQYDDDDNGTADRTDLEVIYIKNGTLRANFPYLVKTAEATEVSISLSDVTMERAISNTLKLSTALADYYVTGTYSSIPSADAAANSWFAVGMDSEGNSAIVTPSNDISAQRWYLSIDEKDSPVLSGSAAASKIFRIVAVGEEDQTTGIRTLYSEPVVDGVFDITGRRLAQPQKGINIINGKKILVK